MADTPVAVIGTPEAGEKAVAPVQVFAFARLIPIVPVVVIGFGVKVRVPFAGAMEVRVPDDPATSTQLPLIEAPPRKLTQNFVGESVVPAFLYVVGGKVCCAFATPAKSTLRIRNRIRERVHVLT